MTVHPFRDTSAFETQGIRENRKKTFNVELTGETLYSLIGYLEHAAEESKRFPEIAQLTGWVMEMRLQLKTQGF